MRIKKLMIANFGKLTQKEYELFDDVTLFFGENEAGKSTLKDFIVGMLFGIEKSRGLAARTDEYTRREPWNGGWYGGSMEIFVADREYLIERNFDKTKKMAKMTDVKTGRERKITFGNMDKSAYVNTLCLSQRELKPSEELEQLLLSYMTNISQTKSMEFDIKKSIQYIKDEKKQLSCEKNEQNISKIRERLREIEEKEIELAQLKEKETVLNPHNMGGDLTEISQYNREKDVTINWESRVSFYRTVTLGGLLVLFIVCILIKLYWFSVFCLGAALLLGCFYYLTDRFCEADDEEGEQEEETLEERASFLLLQKQKEELQRQIYKREELEEEYRQNKKEMEEILYKRKVLSLAQEKLKWAISEVHDEFAYLLNEEVSFILSKITSGKYKEVKVDEKLGILVREKNKFIRSEYLSTGTIEQIYFALRLATAKLLFREENMPIIIDDIFGNFDFMRLEQVLDYLLSQEQQVIIFSCNNEVKSYFEKRKRIRYISE